MTFSCRREAAIGYFAVSESLTFSWCWVAMPGETFYSFPLNKGGDKAVSQLVGSKLS